MTSPPSARSARGLDRPPVVGYVLRMFPQASETFIVNEILELERLGVQVRVFSYRRPKASVPHESVRRIRAPIIYLPDPLYRHPREVIRALRAFYRMDPVRYRSTARYVLAHTLRDRDVDTWRRFVQAVCLAHQIRGGHVQHLHAHFAHGATRVAMLTSMLTGIPYSFTAHARDIFSADVDFRLLREKAERARFVVTVSRFNRDFLVGRMGPATEGRVHVLYNGVDLRKFHPDPAVRREGDLVLGVGRLVEKKGFTYLLRACRILRDQGHRLRCEIVGDGDLRQDLERQVRRLGLQGTVTLVGARSQEELVSFYQRAAVLVMPAVVAGDGNRDALPTVLLEAMACGTSVIASRLTGIPEIVDHNENGLLVTPGDVVGLASALGHLLQSPETRDRFGVAARAKAEARFDVRQNAGSLSRLFGLETRVAARPEA